MKTPVMTEALIQYVQDHNPTPHPILAEVMEVTHKRSDRSMQISQEQGSFLHFLVKLIGAKKIIEIGCYTGYSAISMASALPPDGKLYTFDVNEETSRIALQFFERAGLSHQIELKLGPATHSLRELQEKTELGSFDLAFIDADKENYIAYYEACLKLIRPGGLIVADNVMWGGAVIDEQDQSSSTQGIRKFNEVLREDRRVIQTMVTVADGLFLAMKNRNSR